MNGWNWAVVCDTQYPVCFLLRWEFNSPFSFLDQNLRFAWTVLCEDSEGKTWHFSYPFAPSFRTCQVPVKSLPWIIYPWACLFYDCQPIVAGAIVVSGDWELQSAAELTISCFQLHSYWQNGYFRSYCATVKAKGYDFNEGLGWIRLANQVCCPHCQCCCFMIA